MSLALVQPSAAAAISPSVCAGRKLTESVQWQLWQWLEQNPEQTSEQLQQRLVAFTGQGVSIRHLNRWRRQCGRSRRRGRPAKQRPEVSAQEGELIEFTPQLGSVGVHLFAAWLASEGSLTSVLDRLQTRIEQYGHAHPQVDFPLLHHRRETLHQRFLALLLAPLLGIERLSEYDWREHALATVIGRSYQSSTLNQFLSQLERMDASEALLPVLTEGACGSLNYVDGHMIGYWSRVSMHKGKITMLGRIMAGSQAVVTHDETGQARFVAYYAPDIALSKIIVEYCQTVHNHTASALFVIDRAVNSVALARQFDEQGLGLLCMLDDNEYHGLDSFETTPLTLDADGAVLYSGCWKHERAEDRRRFVIAVPEAGKPLVYWATPVFAEAVASSQWPELYRARNALQELSFKRMIEHGALNINYGRKKLLGPDRHQARQQEKLDQALNSNRTRRHQKAEQIQQQQGKVHASQIRGHGKRLEQRQTKLQCLTDEQQALQHTQQCLHDQVEALGPPRQRADRDTRKQTLMTFRTLLLENLLTTFHALLASFLDTPLSIEAMLTLLFERSGARVETPTEWLYWLNTQGLSRPLRQRLAQIAQALSAMGLTDRGKPIRVLMRERPP